MFVDTSIPPNTTLGQISLAYNHLTSEVEKSVQGFEQLKNANENLHEWNMSFVHLLGAIQAAHDVHGIGRSEKDKNAKAVSVPELIKANGNKEPVTEGFHGKVVNKSELGGSGKHEYFKARNKLHKSMEERLPRTSQSKEKVEKLEQVLFAILSIQNGAILSDIMKKTGSSVLEVNDNLAVLTKLRIIKRKKTRLGNRYYVHDLKD